MTSFKDSVYGAVLGLAIGDALGGPVEFHRRDTFPEVTGYQINYNFDPELPAGSWTDDTSMMIALMDSIIDCNSINPKDQLDRYVRWYMHGQYSITGKCFDIGNQTRKALNWYIATGDIITPYNDVSESGNGALMRHLPVPLFMYQFMDLNLMRVASDATVSTTHSSFLCRQAGNMYCHVMHSILAGLYKTPLNCITEKSAKIPRGKVKSSGFVADTLDAAMWCFATSSSFKECVLKAVNLGDDADTVGAVAGSLAGAYYGVNGIPDDWINDLRGVKQIVNKIHSFLPICTRFLD